MILTDKEIAYSWGNNTYYQLGTDSKLNSECNEPKEVLLENIK